MDNENKPAGEPNVSDSQKDDVLEKAFAHPVVKEIKSDMMRYKEERNSLRAKLETLEKGKEEEEKKKLEQQAEFQKLYEAEKAEKERILESAKQEKIRNAIMFEVQKAGAINPNDANFTHLEGVSIGEDGAVIGVSEAIEKVKAEKPYLFGGKSVQTFGQQPKAGTTSLTYEDLLKDPKLMRKYKDEQPEIFQALKDKYYS
jgi:hypothetical protein